MTRPDRRRLVDPPNESNGCQVSKLFRLAEILLHAFRKADLPRCTNRAPFSVPFTRCLHRRRSIISRASVAFGGETFRAPSSIPHRTRQFLASFPPLSDDLKYFRKINIDNKRRERAVFDTFRFHLAKRTGSQLRKSNEMAEWRVDSSRGASVSGSR